MSILLQKEDALLRPQIEQYLRSHGVDYRLLAHPAALTAEEVAEAHGISGWQVAKGVLVELRNGEEVICVVPAPTVVDLDAVCDVTGSSDAVLCEAGRLIELFPGCDIGAAAPLGGLWNLPMIFDPLLEDMDRICMNGCSVSELIEMSTADYLQLEQPLTAAIAAMPGEPWRHAMPVESPIHW